MDRKEIQKVGAAVAETGQWLLDKIKRRDKRIAELEAQLKETMHLLASTGVALNKAEAQLAIHEASIQGRIDCFAKLKAAEAQLDAERKDPKIWGDDGAFARADRAEAQLEAIRTEARKHPYRGLAYWILSNQAQEKE